MKDYQKKVLASLKKQGTPEPFAELVASRIASPKHVLADAPLSDQLIGGFLFLDTPEGQDFWYSMYEGFCMEEEAKRAEGALTK